MRLVLEIQPGSIAGRSVTIAAGSEVRVGRIAPAQVVLSDPTVSRQHFAIAHDGWTCRIRDLGSTHGTLVNGEPVTAAFLHDGDLIQAGTTTLRVRFIEDAVEPKGVPVAAAPAERTARDLTVSVTQQLPVLEQPTPHELVIRELQSQREMLYAILDAARDPLILARLHQCEEPHQSLYEGAEGDKLAAYAPYLVALPRGSALLETVVRDGWGKSWGVYLTSARPFDEVRKHLRQFLMAQLRGGKQVYFRFYDPRVLRAFLPSCTPEESVRFFGPIRCFCFEADDGVTLRRVENRAGPGGGRTAPASD